MPPPVTDQQAELRRKARRRLIGAIVLVAALVILLPMVLDHEPKPIGNNVPIRIPEAPAVATEASVSSPASAPAASELPAAASAPEPRADLSPADTPAAAPALAVKSEEAPTVETKVETKVEKMAATAEKAEKGDKAGKGAPDKETHSGAKASPESGAKKHAESKPAAPAGGGAFVVQVGAFSNAAKAAQAQKKVAAAGLPVFTETVDVDGQSRIRVRAGPFEQRAQAEAALEKLSDIGFGGKLMMK